MIAALAVVEAGGEVVPVERDAPLGGSLPLLFEDVPPTCGLEISRPGSTAA